MRGRRLGGFRGHVTEIFSRAGNALLWDCETGLFSTAMSAHPLDTQFIGADRTEAPAGPPLTGQMD